MIMIYNNDDKLIEPRTWQVPQLPHWCQGFYKHVRQNGNSENNRLPIVVMRSTEDNFGYESLTAVLYTTPQEPGFRLRQDQTHSELLVGVHVLSQFFPFPDIWWWSRLLLLVFCAVFFFPGYRLLLDPNFYEHHPHHDCCWNSGTAESNRSWISTNSCFSSTLPGHWQW